MIEKEYWEKSKETPSGFYAFCRLFARIIDGNMRFDNKPFQIIQDHFQYFILPECKERLFILETPPRLGKSTLTTILGIVYVALISPKKKAILITANEQTMQSNFVSNIRLIIENEYFLSVCGLNKKDFRVNAKRIVFPNGFAIIFKTTQSRLTLGLGYHYIWLDDFMIPDDLYSPARLFRAHAILDNLMTRSENNRDTGESLTKIIVVNQRLGFKDVSGRFLETYGRYNMPMVRLTLPYHFKAQGDTQYKLYNGKVIEYTQDDYLAPWFNRTSELYEKAKFSNEETFITQYLQICTNLANAVFDVDYLNYYKDIKDIVNINTVFMTVDFAFKTKQHNDYTACIVWGIDASNTDNLKLYALDILWHKKLLHESLVDINNLATKWRRFKGTNGWHGNDFRGLYIEDVASNEGAFMVLGQQSTVPFHKLPRHNNGNEGTGKVVRANLVMNFYKQGVVYLPAFHKNTAPLVNELRMFSRNETHEHDDLVDCCIDGLYITMNIANKNPLESLLKTMQSTNTDNYGYF